MLILGWDFLSDAAAFISCRQRLLHMSETGDVDNRAQSRHRLRNVSDCVVSPGHEQLLMVASDVIDSGDVLVSPTARYLSKGIALASSLVRFINGTALIAVLNITDEPILLPKGAVVVSGADSQPLSLMAVSTSSTGQKHPPTDSAPASALASTISTDLTQQQKDEWLALLHKHKSLFDVHSPLLGQTSAATHRIRVDGTAIVRRRPYRVSSTEREIIDKHVDDMLKRNAIRPSSSPWSSPVVLVQKKDGSVRFCVD